MPGIRTGRKHSTEMHHPAVACPWLSTLLHLTCHHNHHNAALLPTAALSRFGMPTRQVYGQNVMFVANDWHAALLPLLLTARFRPHGVYDNARCALAIHNLAHQGSFDVARFGELGLSGEDWFGALEWRNPEDTRRRTINVLKASLFRGSAYCAAAHLHSDFAEMYLLASPH
jgi:glycogen synthase